MKDLSQVSYNATSEKLVKILCQKTQSTNPLFFRILVAYYFSKVASMMRTNIGTHDRGVIPINMYAINLAVSGAGKGHSTNVVEDHVIHQFKQKFLEETFESVSHTHLAQLALKRAVKKPNGDEAKELKKIEKEFLEAGTLAFSFDSGTTAAVKQMRHKLLLADAGSMNLEIDEIGSNLLGNAELLNAYLELFDVGKIKQKLTKNTSENIRNEEIDGRTPTNMMLYGTPAKLLNGGKVEDELHTFLETGFARRCFFGYSGDSSKNSTLTAEEVYDMLTDTSTESFISYLSGQLEGLADESRFNKTIAISKEVSIEIIQYRLDCEKLASTFPAHQEIKKAELSHRYFKALKLAGTYAFIEDSSELTSDHFWSAVKLAEDSGDAFSQLLNRERNYVKLAKYIASSEQELTHVDLVEDLPFYKGSMAQKQDLMSLAIAYGYKHRIVIKRAFNDGIEFISGDALKEIDLNKLALSHSDHFSERYFPETKVPFDKLHTLMEKPGRHWASHHFVGRHRNEDNSIPGFSLIVLDVDDGSSVDTVKLLLNDYKYLIHTTKSHTPDKHRFRIILPMQFVLNLEADEYKEFMENVYEWIPFEVDTATNQRSRKWETNANCQYFYNEGKLIDPLNFIPKTSKNDEHKKIINDQQSLSNLERWFVNNTASGNRSNQLIKFALLLVDADMTFTEVSERVQALNEKLPNKLSDKELKSTILDTAHKRIQSKE